MEAPPYSQSLSRLAWLALVLSLNFNGRFLEPGPGYNTKRRSLSAVEVPSVNRSAF